MFPKQGAICYATERNGSPTTVRGLSAARLGATNQGSSQELHLNQIDFAKHLNCSSMVVSRWERGLHKPPADCLIAMGKMAGPPTGWYFWKIAGVDQAAARRMLQQS